MRDRIPTPGKENRVKITQDDGQVVEGVLEYADGATQQGDAWSKGNVLPDSIPRSLGLSMQNPQVKDVFEVLADIGNLHVWKKTVVTSQPVPENVLYPTVYNESLFSFGAGDGIDMHQSDSVLVNELGFVSLGTEGNIVSLEWTNALTELQTYAPGKYIQFIASNWRNTVSSKIFKFPTDVSFYEDRASREFYVTRAQACVGQAQVPAKTTVEYLVSTNRGAYADGTAGNTTYEYIGVVGEETRIQTLSYLGTGLYGEANKMILHFDFNPLLVAISGRTLSGNLSIVLPYKTTAYSDGETYGINMGTIMWGEKNISWWGESSTFPGYSLNINGAIYRVVAIGG